MPSGAEPNCPGGLGWAGPSREVVLRVWVCGGRCPPSSCFHVLLTVCAGHRHFLGKNLSNTFNCSAFFLCLNACYRLHIILDCGDSVVTKPDRSGGPCPSGFLVFTLYPYWKGTQDSERRSDLPRITQQELPLPGSILTSK